MRVIVTMPAYRAARTLERTYREIPAGSVDEVLVVDDGSTDDTVRVAERLGLPVRRHAENRGYGANQKTCYDWALARGADAVVLLHPDYQYAPHRIPALLAPLEAERADFSFGSRFKNSDPLEGGMPLYRYVGNRLTTLVENLCLETSFAELHSGMKAYSRRFLQLIGYHNFSDHFVFDSQMVIRAILLGFRIEEVAVPTRYAEDSSSVDVWNSLRYVFETFAELRRGLRDRDEIKHAYRERMSLVELRAASAKGLTCDLIGADGRPSGELASHR